VIRAFCIVGPTAGGKSELAADIAVRLSGEIVNADAFQIYQGFDVLSAKPDPVTLGKVRHHLIGVVSPKQEMSAAKYRNLALPVIADITARAKLPLIVGGTGLYIKALTHGLDDAPAAEPALREELDQLSLEQLHLRLTAIDPAAADTVDMKNRRRVIRALETVELSRRPMSEQRTKWRESSIGGSPMGSVESGKDTSASGRCHESRRSLIGGNKPYYSGVFVFRDRQQLYQRINQRVEAMLREGAIEEVRDADGISRTAEKMIGVRSIREYLAGQISLVDCTARIQQLTRRYAKRQLTWFRHQSTFESLNLSLLKHNEAMEWVLRQTLVGAR
jgi:tRNA dimethylallyltransferase